MASDEIIWQVINQQFCSFKLKATRGQTFCRNEYNVTGLCNRMSCPLANSNYATIRADPASGALYIYVKVVERAHLPSKLWERTRLSSNYAKALEQIDSVLAFWPPYLVHKCKQRLTRLTQVAIKTKRLAKEQERLGEKLVPRLAPKIRKREEVRERKAEAAAKVERAIEKELLERLRSGAYGDRPLNVEESIWKRVLRGLERQGEGIRDVDRDEGIEEEEELEGEEELEDGVNDVEYVSDLEGESDDEDIESLDGWFDGESGDEEEAGDEEEDEDTEASEVSGGDSEEGDEAKTKQPSGAKRKRPPPATKPKKKKMPRVEIEYEDESLVPQREMVRAR